MPSDLFREAIYEWWHQSARPALAKIDAQRARFQEAMDATEVGPENIYTGEGFEGGGDG